jgi:RHS repeat-associated protein
LTISYNHLNLPTRFAFSGNNTIDILYDATGQKLRKTVRTNNVVTLTQEYIGGIELKNNRLEAIYNEEGRAYNTTNATQSYPYTWRREYHYYAFGMACDGPWQGSSNANKTKYLYNGKELNEDFGLNLSDYGARWYDASIGRWWSVDPLAEKTRRYTPYHYGKDNPIRFIDPDGMMAQEPPENDKSYVKFSYDKTGNKDGSYYKKAIYVNVSKQAAKEWNSYNAQNRNKGMVVSEKQYNLETKEGDETKWYAQKDPNSSSVVTKDAVKNGKGAKTSEIGLPVGSQGGTGTVNLAYNMDQLDDKMTVKLNGREIGNTGNQIDTNGSPQSFDIALPDKEGNRLQISVDPLSPNPRNPSYDAANKSIWSFSVTVTVSNTTAVYTSETETSSRSNSISGTEAGFVEEK